MARNYSQGVFKIKNPHKYKGNHTNIVFRSSWELRFMKYLDSYENVIEWSSEETIVPYLYEVDGKMHRYFVDFYAKIRNKDGEIETFLFEIKPANQVAKPNIKKVTAKNQQRIFDWIKNVNKWNAAEIYAKQRGWKFKILTENELYGNKNTKNKKL